MIDFGTFENETLQMDFDTEDGYDFSQIHIGLLDIQMMADAFGQLQRKNTTSGLETGPDFVQFEHISSDGGTLFLPIWFFQGWHCEVNGRETQLEPVLGGWIGVPLEQGNNRIYLTFRPETHWPSVCLSLASLGLGIWFFILKTKGQLGHRWNRLGHVIGYIYLILALVFLLLIYVLPIPLGIYYAVMN